MSGAPRLTEVALEKFVDREIEKLCYANILGGFHALPITKGCEKFLGLDEAVWWEYKQPIPLYTWVQKSGTLFFPPLLLQFKIPDSTGEVTTFTLPRNQFVRMLLQEYLKNFPLYALSLVNMPSELDRGKDNLKEILALVMPSEIGITDLGYEQYRVRIIKNTGALKTTPIETTLGKEPFHIHPKELMGKIVDEMKRLDIPRRRDAVDSNLGMIFFKMNYSNFSNICYCDK